jgi:cell division protein FtsB
MKRRILLSFFIILELILSYNFISRIFYILNTQKHIDTERIQRDVLKERYETRLSEYSYVKTDTYVEEIARIKLGLSKPGDYVYILPTDKNFTVSLPDIALANGESTERASGEVMNWYALFFN